VDRLALAYLGATGLLAAASLRPAGLLLAGVHAVAAGLLYWAVRRGAPAEWESWKGSWSAGGWSGALRFVRLFYPVLLTPLLYHEVSLLGQLHVEGYHDPLVQGWEEALFGVQLSVAASRWLPWTWVSELFHLGYVSYYLLVPGAALAVHLRGTPRDLHRTAVTVAGAFFVCYLIFSVFPVVGPRYLFPPLEGPAAAGPLHDLTHWILEGGSSKGTAFPSSHVAAAVSAWLATRRSAPRWYRWSAPLVWLLVVGTVYGGFHYAVDAAAGLAVGWVAWAASPALCRLWGQPAAGPPGNHEGTEGIQRNG
jgi:membrane-associated phospholipid phosphatase